MEAQKWHEADSIELTQWTKEFSKCTESLPSPAMKSIVGKTTADILSETSIIRHSAVHRLRTSAAITFAEALNDSKRAERVTEIKIQLEASVEEIMQRQILLERKLTDQLEDIARRRAELDDLERSFREEMLATDQDQRTEIGSAFESFLDGSEQEHNFLDMRDKVQADDQGSLDEVEPHNVPHDTSWGSARNEDIPPEPCLTAAEAIPAEVPSVAASPALQSCITASDGEPLPENAPSSAAVSKEDR